MDFSHKIHLLVSPTTNNGPDLNLESGFGGLGVACCLNLPKSAGSNPTKAIRIFKGKKSLARLPLEGK
jgi:hypothetical protein